MVVVWMKVREWLEKIQNVQFFYCGCNILTICFKNEVRRRNQTNLSSSLDL
ncbi:hypothetical protein LEP1GSC199_0145 [Leptospira vanthielii serovar Holland str. Waz Holland = ATCC 700522]|uniref:Uncharacterized protein n=1 Tax=Leptospira vanthielii serovar Holland str. Waz Holland = ATCC 700522 TaxID=1218591 RepID=N1W833_9LEPT|nr:hypothetical protein LEP1GSC199_0145 [Leptospira vanthielii serovar Holland str. Waz Holland = ATCC 700522]